MQMPVEGDRVVELVDAEAMFSEPGDTGTEQPAASGNNQSVVSESLLRTLSRNDIYHLGLGIDRLGAAFHIGNVNGLQHIQERSCQSLRFRLIEPRPDHQRRLR